MAEGVRVAGGYHLVQPGALFGEEAGVLLILLRPRQVDLFVRGVHIATEDDRFFFAEFLDELEEGVIETELIVEAHRPLAAIGEVNVEEPEVFKLCTHNAAFLVKFFDTHTVNYFKRLYFRVERNATVALFDLTRRKESRVTGRGEECFGELVRRGLGLLEAEDVGLHAREK